MNLGALSNAMKKILENFYVIGIFKLFDKISLSDEILDKVQEAGFSIAMAKEVNLTREEAEDFYSEHKGKDFFESLVQNMCRYCYHWTNEDFLRVPAHIYTHITKQNFTFQCLIHT